MPRGVPRNGRRRMGRPAGPIGGSVVGSLTVAMNELVAQRAALDAQIASLQGMISTMGGVAPAGPRAAAAAAAPVAAAGRGRRGRPPRSGSLKEFILKVLTAAGDVMAVKDIAEGVVKAGYKSKNQTLAKSVGIALRELSAQVQKVGRGRFRLK